MKKILFLIDSLRGGGAEKVLVNLVNNMNLTEYDVTVETMFFEGINAQFLKEGIHLKNKNAPYFKGVSHVLKYIPERLLYRYFIGEDKYDVLVAFIHGAPAKVIAGCPYSHIKKLVWLHTAEMERGTIWKFWKTREKTIEAYSGYDRIVAVSQSVKDAFNSYAKLGDKVTVKYNVNDVIGIKALAEESFHFDSDRFCICTLGRLSEEKGFDRLIRIAGRLSDEALSFQINILGKGPCEEQLRSLIKANGLEQTVFLRGYTENPYRILGRSDLFVCSSLAEGMSTALSEAVILGVPAVSVDVAGAKEILGSKNEYGIVTENNEESLFEAVRSMIKDKAVYDKYSALVKQRSAFFDTDKRVKEITDLFD